MPTLTIRTKTDEGPRQRGGHGSQEPRRRWGARYQGLRSAEPHAASGSGDVYLDDGTNTADGNHHERLDEPASGTWVDL